MSSVSNLDLNASNNLSPTPNDSFIGLLLTSNSGPSILIDEIEDFEQTNVGMLKDVLK